MCTFRKSFSVILPKIYGKLENNENTNAIHGDCLHPFRVKEIRTCDDLSCVVAGSTSYFEGKDVQKWHLDPEGLKKVSSFCTVVNTWLSVRIDCLLSSTICTPRELRSI